MEQSILVLVEFKIWGELRFLSHAEMLRLFQRACVRGGVKLRYSQGFNPRPKMSLPLPRPVGVASEGDLLALQLDSGESDFDSKRFTKQLSGQLPAGCEVISVRLAKTKKAVQPEMATYIVPVSEKYVDEKLKERISWLLASKSLNIDRTISAKGRIRNIDVRGFLSTIELNQAEIVVQCKVTSAGSIRVQEILSLLELDMNMLSGPLRRTDIKWQKN